MQVIMELLVDCEFEAAVAGCCGGVLRDNKFFVAKVHQAVVVKIICAVGGKEVVELVKEFLGTDVDKEFVAEVVLLVELEGEAVVGSVDNHDAVHAVACRHIGDVERLTLSPFVAYECPEALDDVV